MLRAINFFHRRQDRSIAGAAVSNTMAVRPTRSAHGSQKRLLEPGVACGRVTTTAASTRTGQNLATKKSQNQRRRRISLISLALIGLMTALDFLPMAADARLILYLIELITLAVLFVALILHWRSERRYLAEAAANSPQSKAAA